jgi:hypothetical protein
MRLFRSRQRSVVSGSSPPGVMCLEEGLKVSVADVGLYCPVPQCPHHQEWLSPKQFLKSRQSEAANLGDRDVRRLAQLFCPRHPGMRLMPVCPEGHELWLTFQGGDRVVALTGTFYSGKTTFLPAFEHRVHQSWSRSFQTCLTLFPVERAVVYERDIRTPYLAGLAPQKTWERQYFFFEIGGAGDWPPGLWRLAFYDGPGDPYSNPERAEEELLYLAHARQILFTLDPYLIPALGPYLPPLDAKVSEIIRKTSATTALSVLIQLLRKWGTGGTNGSIPVDLAVLIPKLDLIPDEEQFVPRRERAILVPDPPPGTITSRRQLKDASRLAEKVLAGPFNMGEFVNLAKKHFCSAGFFFYTAWGPGGRCSPPQPVGVENPFLWLMHLHGDR